MHDRRPTAFLIGAWMMLSGLWLLTYGLTSHELSTRFGDQAGGLVFNGLLVAMMHAVPISYAGFARLSVLDFPGAMLAFGLAGIVSLVCGIGILSQRSWGPRIGVVLVFVNCIAAVLLVMADIRCAAPYHPYYSRLGVLTGAIFTFLYAMLLLFIKRYSRTSIEITDDGRGGPA